MSPAIPDKSEPAPETLPGAARAGFLSDVIEGLSAAQKSFPGKYLWDETGSTIFDEICRSATYYPTIREMPLLEACAPEVAKIIGPGACVVEFGSGASHKIRLLLDAMEAPKRYVAMDISRDFLNAAAHRVRRDYPAVEVLPVCADYSMPFPVLPISRAGGVLGFFPGATIGNMDPPSAIRLLNRIREAIAPAWLLIGHDPNSDPESLKKAYSGEVMAAFHKNGLARMARELGAEISLEDFAHEARLLQGPTRIEAHLIAKKPTTIRAGGREFSMAPGASIRTDISWKHTLAGFENLVRGAGWTTVRNWTDADQLFALSLLGAIR